MIWDTLTTTFLSTIGKGIGFLIPFFIAAWFGVTSETDAFFFAYGLILFLSGIFAPVVETIIVPYIVEAKSNQENVGRFVGQVMGISGLGITFLSGLFILCVKPFLLLVTHFDSKSLSLIYSLFLETSPLIILLVWTSILAGSLNAYKKFSIPAVSPGLRAVIILSFVFALKDVLQVHAIAWGYVAGELVRLLVLLIVVQRFRLFKLSISFAIEAKLWHFLRTSFYQILGMVALSLNPLINKAMASWLGVGSVSSLEYAERLFLIPSNLLILGLVTIILSHWSDKFYGGERKQLKSGVSKVAKWIASLSLIIMVFLILTKDSVVNLAYGHGNFPNERLHLVSMVWMFYLLGLVFHCLHHVYVRAQLVKKNTQIVFITAVVMNIATIGLNLFLMNIMGVPGIALTTSIVYGLSVLILMRDFYIRT